MWVETAARPLKRRSAFLPLLLFLEGLPLGLVPSFATVHRFCTSWSGPRNSDFVRTLATNNFKGIFAWFMTMREKKTLAREIEIPKKFHTLLCISELFRLLLNDAYNYL